MYPRVMKSMVMGSSRIIAVVCLVLALVGQSLAFARVPCAMASSPGPMMSPMMDGSHDMSAMDHSQHVMPADNIAKDCCGEEACSMAHCLSSPSMSVASHIQGTGQAGAVFQLDSPPAYSSTPPGSLYRPPNSR